MYKCDIYFDIQKDTLLEIFRKNFDRIRIYDGKYNNYNIEYNKDTLFPEEYKKLQIFKYYLKRIKHILENCQRYVKHHIKLYNNIYGKELYIHSINKNTLEFGSSLISDIRSKVDETLLIDVYYDLVNLNKLKLEISREYSMYHILLSCFNNKKLKDISDKILFSKFNKIYSSIINLLKIDNIITFFETRIGEILARINFNKKNILPELLKYKNINNIYIPSLFYTRFTKTLSKNNIYLFN